jgi:hypothetical protein
MAIAIRGRDPSGLVAGDFDEDGHPDLAVPNVGDGTVSMYLDACY